eukprot:m.173961 g.173961  ORF g.173961 m.173961 type:complete len:840 (+) comp31747_c1_seq1:319-2838(+)
MDSLFRTRKHGCSRFAPSYVPVLVTLIVFHTCATSGFLGPSCFDEPQGWKDINDLTCEDYVRLQKCITPGQGLPGFHLGTETDVTDVSTLSQDGISAFTACCICGGGYSPYNARLQGVVLRLSLDTATVSTLQTSITAKVSITTSSNENVMMGVRVMGVPEEGDPMPTQPIGQQEIELISGPLKKEHAIGVKLNGNQAVYSKVVIVAYASAIQGTWDTRMVSDSISVDVVQPQKSSKDGWAVTEIHDSVAPPPLKNPVPFARNRLLKMASSQTSSSLSEPSPAPTSPAKAIDDNPSPLVIDGTSQDPAPRVLQNSSEDLAPRSLQIDEPSPQVIAPVDRVASEVSVTPTQLPTSLPTAWQIPTRGPTTADVTPQFKLRPQPDNTVPVDVDVSTPPSSHNNCLPDTFPDSVCGLMVSRCEDAYIRINCPSSCCAHNIAAKKITTVTATAQVTVADTVENTQIDFSIDDRLPFANSTYVMTDVGNCGTHEFVVSIQECVAAAKYLNLEDTTPTQLFVTEPDSNRRPHGCYYTPHMPDNYMLFFNTFGDVHNNDTSRTSICRNTGDVENLPDQYTTVRAYTVQYFVPVESSKPMNTSPDLPIYLSMGGVAVLFLMIFAFEMRRRRRLQSPALDDLQKPQKERDFGGNRWSPTLTAPQWDDELDREDEDYLRVRDADDCNDDQTDQHIEIVCHLRTLSTSKSEGTIIEQEEEADDGGPQHRIPPVQQGNPSPRPLSVYTRGDLDKVLRGLEGEALDSKAFYPEVAHAIFGSHLSGSTDESGDCEFERAKALFEKEESMNSVDLRNEVDRYFTISKSKRVRSPGDVRANKPTEENIWSKRQSET